jgi:hypothetical protein
MESLAIGEPNYSLFLERLLLLFLRWLFDLALILPIWEVTADAEAGRRFLEFDCYY